MEMALVTPLLLILVLGIIEFGWLFGQFNEVRHAVRETARYAAVSNPDKDGDGDVDDDDVTTVLCDSLNLPTGSSIDLTMSVVDSNGDGDLGTVGDNATASVTAAIPTLTNVPFITVFIPSSLSNSAEFRIEQDIQWTPTLSAIGLSC